MLLSLADRENVIVKNRSSIIQTAWVDIAQEYDKDGSVAVLRG